MLYKIVDPSTATLLGSPIGDMSSVSDTLTSKVNQLKRMGKGSNSFQHMIDVILLLRHSFSLPNLLYNLRTASCFPIRVVHADL